MASPLSSNKAIISAADFTFSAASKTITLGGLFGSMGLQLKNFLLITNVQSGTNQVIYQFNKVGYGATYVEPVLTLDFDTALMNDADELMIIVQAEGIQQNVSVQGPVSTNLAEYNSDSPHSNTERGTQILGVANESNVALSDTDGDYTPMATNRKGHVKVNVENLSTSSLGLETTLQLIKTAVEKIDDFISGSKGLVTEDNSAAILAQLEVLDNFISGSKGLVTEDNSAAIKTAVEIIDNAIVVEDAVLPSNPTGNLQMARKRDLVTAENVSEGDGIALNATDRGELLAAITDLSHIIRKNFSSLSDLAETIRRTGAPMVAVDLTNSGTLAAITAISSLSVVSTVTTVSSVTNMSGIGGRQAELLVDNSIEMIAQSIINRVITY